MSDCEFSFLHIDEILEREEQGSGATMVQVGYRLAMLVSSAGALYLAEYTTWGLTYIIMAALIGVGATTVLCSREPMMTPAVAPDRPHGSDRVRRPGRCGYPGCSTWSSCPCARRPDPWPPGSCPWSGGCSSRWPGNRPPGRSLPPCGAR